VLFIIIFGTLSFLVVTAPDSFCGRAISDYCLGKYSKYSVSVIFTPPPYRGIKRYRDSFVCLSVCPSPRRAAALGAQLS